MAPISFSGLASGIDGDAVIKATLDARRLAYKPLENNIEDNKRETNALAQLNTKLLTLSDSLKELRTLAGSGIAKTAISSAEDILGVSASSAAPLSSTNVTVQQLAKGATFSFLDRFDSVEKPIAPGLSGSEKLTFTVGEGSEAKNIEAQISSTTTLKEVVEQLNTAGAGKIATSVVNVGTESSPKFSLVVSSLESGTIKGSLRADVGEALQAQGIFRQQTIDQAKDSRILVDGIGEITRSSNKISDVIPGVTLDLKQTGAVPIQVRVLDDRDKTAERVKKIIGQINEIITFSKENSRVQSATDEKGRSKNVYADLAKNRVDDQAVSAIKQVLSEAVATNGTDVKVFADLGITTNRDGTLNYNQETFVTALAKDSAGAAQLLNTLGDKLSGTGEVLDQFTRYQGIIDSSKTANDTESKSLQERIDMIERSLEKQQQTLKQIFANLETKVSRLNNSNGALASLAQSVGSK